MSDHREVLGSIDVIRVQKVIHIDHIASPLIFIEENIKNFESFFHPLGHSLCILKEFKGAEISNIYFLADYLNFILVFLLLLPNFSILRLYLSIGHPHQFLFVFADPFQLFDYGLFHRVLIHSHGLILNPQLIVLFQQPFYLIIRLLNTLMSTDLLVWHARVAMCAFNRHFAIFFKMRTCINTFPIAAAALKQRLLMMYQKAVGWKAEQGMRTGLKLYGKLREVERLQWGQNPERAFAVAAGTGWVEFN